MVKKDKVTVTLILAAVLVPVLQASVLFLVHFLKYGTGIPYPVWTDEATYCSILKTWAKEGCHDFFGNALGYYGYNGEHALIGHGSAWNPAVILPYMLFVKIFRYGTSVIWYSNVIFLTLAVLIFILLINPVRKNLIYLIILEMVSGPVVLYLSTDMTEILRYSYAIILAGLIYRLYEREEDNFIIRYIVSPVAILFMMQAYIFFVFIVPVYMWGILRQKKVWVRITGVITGSLVSGGGSYLLLHFISSNYDTYKTDALLKALSAPNFIMAVKQVWWVIEAELDGALPLLFHGAYGHGLIKWFLIAIITTVAYSIAKCIIYAIKRKRYYTYLISLFCILLFNGAFWTLYSIEVFTLFRSISIVLLFSLYLCISDAKKNDVALLMLMAVGMIFVPANEADFSKDRFLAASEKEINLQLEEELAQVMPVKSDSDAWEATALIYTMEPRVITAMPAGTGINLMFDDRIIEDAGYLFISKRQGNQLNPEWLEQSYSDIYENNKELIDGNYNILWENNSYILYRRKNR